MERLTNINREIPRLVGNANATYWLQVYIKLKEYENLEEQGRLLKLPCKVGDIVYEICGETVRGYDWKILTYETAYVRKVIFNLSRFYDIGKTVFLTKSEAEEKLKN